MEYKLIIKNKIQIKKKYIFSILLNLKKLNLYI